MGDAIRHPKRGKAHRPVRVTTDMTNVNVYTAPACNTWDNAEWWGLIERVPVERTAPKDRCRKCFPNAS